MKNNLLSCHITLGQFWPILTIGNSWKHRSKKWTITKNNSKCWCFQILTIEKISESLLQKIHFSYASSSLQLVVQSLDNRLPPSDVPMEVTKDEIFRPSVQLTVPPAPPLTINISPSPKKKEKCPTPFRCGRLHARAPHAHPPPLLHLTEKHFPQLPTNTFKLTHL